MLAGIPIRRSAANCIAIVVTIRDRFFAGVRPLRRKPAIQRSREAVAADFGRTLRDGGGGQTRTRADLIPDPPVNCPSLAGDNQAPGPAPAGIERAASRSPAQRPVPMSWAEASRAPELQPGPDPLAHHERPPVACPVDMGAWDTVIRPRFARPE